MAQRVTVVLEEDLDGGQADETVRFAFGSADYEIDLSAKNAHAFRRGPLAANKTGPATICDSHGRSTQNDLICMPSTAKRNARLAFITSQSAL